MSSSRGKATDCKRKRANIRESERRMIKKGLGKRGINRIKTSRREMDLQEKRGKWVSQEKKKAYRKG